MARVAWAILLAFLVMGALIGVATVLQGELFGETQAKVLGTTAALAAFSVMALPSALHFEQGRYRPLSGPAVLASAVSFMLLLVFIWSLNADAGETFYKTLGTFIVVALSANHVSLMLLATARQGIVWGCLKATVVAIAALAVLVTVAFWTENGSGAMGRILGTLLILDVLASIAVPVLARINPSAPSPSL